MLVETPWTCASARCPVEESRSLARVLEVANKPAHYVEFDGPYTIPAEVVRSSWHSRGRM
jgi:hypothetical protein